jgi:hypothetical protein
VGEWAFVSFKLDSFSFLLDEPSNEARVHSCATFNLGKVGDPSIGQGFSILVKISFLVLDRRHFA